MGANAAPAVVRMAHQRRRPIANGCVVCSKSTIGLIRGFRGETFWVGAGIGGDGGRRARVRQHSGVVTVSRPRWNTGRGHKATSGL
jgi:hypothetical protein